MRAAFFACGLLLVFPVHGEEALYLVAGAAPISAAANGYHQEVTRKDDGDFAVHVVTTLAPIESAGSYGGVLMGEKPDVPEDFKLPRRLSRELTPDLGAWEAATLVLAWVSKSLAVDTGDEGPQDAVSVLARGRGRCSGLANAAVAMLRAAGFEARTVSGLLVGDTEAIPHRWIECRLPAAGWVPSDPTLGLWTVTPRHLVFADTVTTTPHVEVVESGDDGLKRLPRHEGQLLRPNLGADLVCRLDSAMTAPLPLATLHGSGGEIRRARLDPEARFSGLLPGRWVLEVEAGGEIIERRTFFLRSGGYNSYTVKDILHPPEIRPGS
ncbi:MAG: transglutaminase-like domain-containing protein [Acidobacteriota bacterium]|nr:transglutaminase-like domain-containing protein [Acidobacteriota bacterium]